ncbi:MAG: histidine kinase dimerization/phosphoacceptor domain-containing protein, partial [Actinobacteria bacterium]|nr:histidine kinase dimerization/phosphoacceptor domain-containing protein [Actinomycetota bacterium]
MNDLLARAARWLPLAVLTAFAVIGVISHGADALRVILAVVAVLAALRFRPERPAWQLSIAALVSVAAVTIICHGSSGNPGWFAPVTVVGWMAWIARANVWAPVYAATMSVIVVEAVLAPDHGWLPWLAGTTFAVVACWFAQHERRLAEQLRAAQAGLAERARVEERNRIAHEIHDAVAHSLTVSLLHIAGARLALDDDVEEARHLMAEAEDLGRVALTEVRQAVGLLREDGRVDGLLPG